MASSRPDGRAIDLSGRSVDELKQIRARVDSLLTIAGAAPAPEGSPVVTDDSPQEELIFDALLRHLKARATDQAPPASVFRRAPWWAAFRRNAGVVTAWLKQNAPATFKHKRRRRRAYYMVVGVLIRWLERVHVPVTPRSIALNLDKVPAVMDQQFPDYAASGLIEWVFGPQ